MDNIFAEAALFLASPLKAVFTAFSPLWIGLTIAYIFGPATDWLCRYMKRGPAILLAYTAVLASLLTLLYSFIILITGSISSGGLLQSLETVYEYFESAAEKLNAFLPGSNISLKLSSTLSNMFSFDSIGFTQLKELFSQFSSYIVSFVLGVVASIYLLKDRDFFLRKWNAMLSLILPQKLHGQLLELWAEINDILRTFIKGAFIDSAAIAFLSAAALTFMKIDFGVIIGIIGGILNIIPYFGPIFGMIPAFISGFLNGGLLKGIAAVVVLFIIQQIDCNYIYPKIVGKSTGLHPLYVLIAVSIAGKFFGILGMLLAVPSAGIIQILIKKWAYR